MLLELHLKHYQSKLICLLELHRKPELPSCKLGNSNKPSSHSNCKDCNKSFLRNKWMMTQLIRENIIMFKTWRNRGSPTAITIARIATEMDYSQVTWKGKTKRGQSQEYILKLSKKTQYLMNTLYIILMKE